MPTSSTLKPSGLLELWHRIIRRQVAVKLLSSGNSCKLSTSRRANGPTQRPLTPSEQKLPGLGSSTDPMLDPSNLRTMLDQWQFTDKYKIGQLFPKEKLKEITNHGQTLRMAVQRINTVRDLDLKLTGDTPKILQGQMTKIPLLFKYIQWAREEAIMRNNGLDDAFKSRFPSDTLVKKMEEVPETGLKFEAPDWDATAAENGGADPDAIAAKAKACENWHRDLALKTTPPMRKST
ncbi:uncharacterized protein Aud_005217 [Aspergillus udagawae]|uniref:Uncharacterized protein n=1 Tax=Aspergillus udagawae TaxID=91492 RepID=A0A8E0QTZ5_9EURO|nr:uncharacterized protein Aud_005217 [Aspergillus udagawae]GIC88816.1 hypothetical protein Aud_005217 [Aspergillus udagawae]